MKELMLLVLMLFVLDTFKMTEHLLYKAKFLKALWQVHDNFVIHLFVCALSRLDI